MTVVRPKGSNLAYSPYRGEAKVGRTTGGSQTKCSNCGRMCRWLRDYDGKYRLVWGYGPNAKVPRHGVTRHPQDCKKEG